MDANMSIGNARESVHLVHHHGGLGKELAPSTSTCERLIWREEPSTTKHPESRRAPRRPTIDTHKSALSFKLSLTLLATVSSLTRLYQTHPHPLSLPTRRQQRRQDYRRLPLSYRRFADRTRRPHAGFGRASSRRRKMCYLCLPQDPWRKHAAKMAASGQRCLCLPTTIVV